MAQGTIRDIGPADTIAKAHAGGLPPARHADRTRWTPILASLALASCVSYEPAPLDVSEILRELESREAPVATAADPSADEPGFAPEELAAFAVTNQPRLSALRAELGVRDALLVEAGLLPDVELGWDAMDVLASRWVDGSSSQVDALSGLGLMVPLPKPGERDARVGAARWNAEESRRRIAAAEWSLTRNVFLACEEVRAADELLARTRTLVEVAESTNDYFRRAREAGTATGIQASLALGELQAIRIEEVRAAGRADRARQELDALLGLPPGTPLELRAPAESPPVSALADRGPEELVRDAVVLRPDLAELAARYRAAEESVRLAVLRQAPAVSIGTGLRLELPLLSGWGRPAIETAIARREQVGRELTAAVHDARAEIAAAHASWKLALRELELVESELLPNAERALELARESFRAGELTLLETLALQRALVEARTRHTEVRALARKRAWSLLAACGRLLVPDPKNATAAAAEDHR
jgi:cobalt-zinc-cadmium efflux system outer membrane protein